MRDEKDIILANCASELIDYSEEEQSILFMDKDGNFIEKSLVTGEEEKYDMTEFNQFVTKDSENPIQNLNYAPEKQEVSFAYEGNIYVYNLAEKQVHKITECFNSEYSDSYNIYQWKNKEECYVLGNSIHRELYLFNCEEETSQLVVKAIWSFCLSEDGKKLFAISFYSEPNAVGFQIIYQIVEIDLENGKEHMLVEEFDSENSVLKCVDDKYLYYVEQHGQKKWCKLYCMNLETGEKKCIYKTDKKIVGIIER